MADSPDAPFALYDEQLRAITDLNERWIAYLELAKHLEDELELWRRRQRQEIALGFYRHIGSGLQHRPLPPQRNEFPVERQH